MKLFNKLGVAATVVVLALGGVQTQANAATLTGNMIQYGEFDDGFELDMHVVKRRYNQKLNNDQKSIIKNEYYSKIEAQYYSKSEAERGGLELDEYKKDYSENTQSLQDYRKEYRKNTQSLQEYKEKYNRENPDAFNNYKQAMQNRFDQGNAKEWYVVTASGTHWVTNGTDDKDKNEVNESTQFELWGQNFKSFLGTGTDGNPTGRHLEIGYNSSLGKGGEGPNKEGTTISQIFDIKTDSILSGSALFSFDAWSRANGTGSVKLVRLPPLSDSLDDSDTVEEILLDEDITANTENWTKNIWTVKNISAGDRLRVDFTANQDDSVETVHIDGVSFVAKEVPEPTSMLGILAVGAFGTVSTLKRKKLKEV